LRPTAGGHTLGGRAGGHGRLGGLLSCDGRPFVLVFVLVFAFRGGLLHTEHGALQYLVVQFGFSEQNRPCAALACDSRRLRGAFDQPRFVSAIRTQFPVFAFPLLALEDR
jgi:hypothetical protein